MKLKVCGLKHPENITEIATMSIDYMGFIFYKQSPRYVEENISFDFVRTIPKHIQKTGVFVNDKPYSIFNAIAHYNLEVVQLHGAESEQLCKELKPYVKVIKAFGIDEQFDFSELEKYIPYVDYFLFDTFTESHGGSGKQFNHDILNKYTYDTPFFISGGIHPESIEKIKQLDLKQLHGIDINSKFELSSGLKDPAKINLFINQLKQSEHAKL